MKVFRAETGEPIKWNLKPSLIKTVDELKQTFEDECGVPMSDQILMTSFGKLVKQDNLTKVLESTGKDEYIVFCYDRRYLSVDEESIEALLAAETPSLEPRVNQLDGTFILKHVQASLKNKISIQDTCQAFISLFSTFDSHSQTLTKTVTTHIHLSQQIVQAQKFQSMALNVAITNLESHRKLADVCIRSFITQAQTELDHQQHLLDAIDQDLTLLKHVRIHSSIASHKRLIDFVDIQNIQHMRHDTQDLCSYLKEHMNSLNEEIQQLKEDEDSFADGVAEKNKGLQELDELLADMLLIQQKCNYLRDKIQRDLRRVYEKISKLVPLNQLLEGLRLSENGKKFPLEDSTSSQNTNNTQELSMSTKQQHQQHIESSSSSSTIKRMLDAFSHLAEIHVYDYLPKLIEYERQIREHTTHLISLKRDSISIFVRHMAVVSEFQRHVGNIQPIVDQHQLHLLQFKSRYPRGLECVRDLLFSYGALMIEKVRRKEYMVLLVNNVSGIADAFSEFSKQEEARREAFENTVMKSLPFKLGTMMNKSAAQCKVSIQGLLAEEDGIEKKDILDFISIITQVYYSQLPTKLLRHQEEQNDWLLQLLNKMMKEMDEMNNKFLKSIRENLLKQQMEDDGKKAFIMNDTSSAMVARLTPKLIVSTAIATASATASASVSASSSSDFSVVEDDYKKLVIENKELKNKLGNMEEEMNLLEQKNQEQAEEISQLRELVKTLENEKEEFESHRRSFLNELKNKDKTADFRLASAEEEFHAKMSDLQYELEEERRMKNNLEIEYASELNTLQTERDHLIKDQQKLVQLQKEMEQLKTHVSQLQSELESKERTTNEIRQLQEQTRVMVKRAQEDWEAKSDELVRIKSDQAILEDAIHDLLHRWSAAAATTVTTTDDQQPLHLQIQQFKTNLEVFEREYEITKANLDAATLELTELTDSYAALIDVHDEWRSIASCMAERLEDFRKHLVFEIVNQLQLPVDERILNVLQQKVTGSDDDAAIWNQVLQLASSIDTAKFVMSVRKRVRDVYDQAKQFKKEYRNTKEKYNKLYALYCEKITFRNFRVGDVALFSPSRNSADGRPWAAFNLNSPHYFLRNPDTTKEYILARITAITEYIASNDENPFRLTEGTKYYVVDVEHWKKQQQVSKKRPISHDSGLASITSAQEQQQAKRPSFGNLTSGFVHSYTTAQQQQLSKD